MVEHLTHRVTKALVNALHLPMDNSSRIVMMSDCHRGDGSSADNFYGNLNIYTTALQWYEKTGYTYIELGDGDELWACKIFANITNANAKVFDILSKFYQQGRLYMIYGNHDIVKRERNWARRFYYDYLVRFNDKHKLLFPNIELHESIVLDYGNTGHSILLLHGHQVDCLNSAFWRLARFLVRYLWHPLETWGVKNPMSPVNSPSKKGVLESYLSDWSVRHNQMLIAGHTHRTAFPKVGEPLYFNDGCCVYPEFITALEICGGQIGLVKWSYDTTENGLLFVNREILKEPVKLSDYFAVGSVCMEGNTKRAASNKTVLFFRKTGRMGGKQI